MSRASPLVSASMDRSGLPGLGEIRISAQLADGCVRAVSIESDRPVSVASAFVGRPVEAVAQAVATLRLPKQKFDSPAQMAFAKQLSYNPWHTIADHRPLGNQNRARRRMYLVLSGLRHSMNAVPHYEPTGNEVFE